MLRERPAPQERCVQLCFSSKSGGVIFPSGALGAHLAFVLLGFVGRKRRVGVNYRRRRTQRYSSTRVHCRQDEKNCRLLDEKSFAQLIAADERLDRAVAPEHVLDFPILIDLLRRKDSRG